MDNLQQNPRSDGEGEMSLKCPDCGEELDHFRECGTYWMDIDLQGNAINEENQEHDVEFIYCPKCNADITQEVNKWFRLRT